MIKSDVKKAIAEKWRVVDDFGVKGTVTGLSAGEHLTVQFDRHEREEIVHYRRVNRLREGE